MAGDNSVEQAKIYGRHLAIFIGAFAGAIGSSQVLDVGGSRSVDSRIAVVESQLADLRLQFGEFRAPGSRFTKADGDAHDRRLKDLERLLQEVRDENREMKYHLHKGDR